MHNVIMIKLDYKCLPKKIDITTVIQATTKNRLTAVHYRPILCLTFSIFLCCFGGLDVINIVALIQVSVEQHA